MICSDKTGTLTKNEMTIGTVLTASAEVEVSGSGYRPDGELLADGRPLEDPVALDEVRAVLAAGCLANDAVLRRDGDEWTIHGDPSDAAFLVAEAKVAGLSEAREARFERVGELPFTSERKLMSSVESDLQRGGEIAVVTKGAPDVLLSRCESERVRGEVRSLTEARRAGDPRLGRAPRRSSAAPAGRRLPAAAAGRATAAGGVGRRARARLPGDGGHDRPTASRGAGGRRRGRRRRRSGDDDHRRPPAHGRSHRGRPRHRRARLPDPDRR